MKRILIPAVAAALTVAGAYSEAQEQPTAGGAATPVSEVIITGTGSWRYVAVLFSHESFPGVRFAPPPDKHAPVWLMEEIETGALHRMMQDQPAADGAGIVWTTWGATAPSDP